MEVALDLGLVRMHWSPSLVSAPPILALPQNSWCRTARTARTGKITMRGRRGSFKSILSTMHGKSVIRKRRKYL